jgi:hypothetical protein
MVLGEGRNSTPLSGQLLPLPAVIRRLERLGAHAIACVPDRKLGRRSDPFRSNTEAPIAHLDIPSPRERFDSCSTRPKPRTCRANSAATLASPCLVTCLMCDLDHSSRSVPALPSWGVSDGQVEASVSKIKT